MALVRKSAGVFLFQLCFSLVNQISVQDMFHAEVDIVAEPADVISLEVAGYLDQENGGYIDQHQIEHVGEEFTSGKDIQKTLCELTFKPGAGEQTDIIEQSSGGNNKKGFAFRMEIVADTVGRNRFFSS